MDESANATRPGPETPTPQINQLNQVDQVAQLLRLIELQAAAERNRRPLMPVSLRGVSFRWGSLIAIIIFAIGSVIVMEWMLSQIPRPPAHPANAGQVSTAGSAAAQR
jgi:hypothetical protein